MRALKKEPGKPWETVEVENTLEALQAEVDGRLEACTIFTDATVLCDEEGRLKGKRRSTALAGIPFVGTVLVVGVAGDEFIGLTEKQEENLRWMVGE